MKLLLTVLLAMFLCGCATVPGHGKSGKAGDGSTVVCHKGKKTLNLPQDAVRAHLDHGDHLGPCQ
jgi:hypothetical protein